MLFQLLNLILLMTQEYKIHNFDQKFYNKEEIKFSSEITLKDVDYTLQNNVLKNIKQLKYQKIKKIIKTI